MFRLIDLFFSLLEKITGCAVTKTGDALYNPEERLYPVSPGQD